MTKEERQFVETVWQHYRTYGRHDLPWRKTTSVYPILVSEVMLQQTQVERVVPKYQTFLKRFPTTKALAEAPLKDVLIAWQGLGYNRRAKALKQATEIVRSTRSGRWPSTYEELLALPGVGPYTAGAVSAFAYNKSIPIIETNIRTVYLHHFFSQETDVSEAALLAKVTATLDTNNPRAWYYALMDYGSYLKRQVGNLNHQTTSYTKQSSFSGSDRQLRGIIIRLLSTSDTVSYAKMKQATSAFSDLRLDAQLERLTKEGMIVKEGRSYQLPT
jgi:A/G-specific adenine glycosylase